MGLWLGMQNMNLKFEKREHYGEVRFYPMCDKSKFLCGLSGRKTFHAQQLVDIKRNLGYNVEIIQNDPVIEALNEVALSNYKGD